MSDYDEIRAAVDASMTASSRFTFSTLVLGLMEVHGGSAPVWRKRIRELLSGKALVRGVDPGAKRRVRTPRILPGPNTVEQALALAIPAPRVRARDQARGRVPRNATPPTAPPTDAPGRTVRGDGGVRAQAEHEAWVDANWDNFTGAERRYWNFDRAAREQRRLGYSRIVVRADARADAMPPMGHPGNEYRGNR